MRSGNRGLKNGIATEALATYLSTRRLAASLAWLIRPANAGHTCENLRPLKRAQHEADDVGRRQRGHGLVLHRLCRKRRGAGRETAPAACKTSVPRARSESGTRLPHKTHCGEGDESTCTHHTGSAGNMCHSSRSMRSLGGLSLRRFGIHRRASAVLVRGALSRSLLRPPLPVEGTSSTQHALPRDL